MKKVRLIPRSSGVGGQRFVALIISILFVVVTNAQQGWDSTYRPPIYQSLARQFASFPTSKKDIIFLGNSISSYTSWSELIRNPNARGRGIPGDITFGVLERLDDIVRGKPAKVFILIGTNDIARNFPDSVILNNYRRIIQRIRSGSPRTTIYFQTILPVNNTFTPSLQHFNKEERILAVNAGLKKLAAEENIVLIDLYSLFLDSNNKLVKEYTYDGLHLNDKGYQLWAQLLKNGNYLN